MTRGRPHTLKYGLDAWVDRVNRPVGHPGTEMIYKNSSCKCASRFCENCESLEKEIHYLLKTVDKCSKGQSNLEFVLASQKCVFWQGWVGV